MREELTLKLKCLLELVKAEECHESAKAYIKSCLDFIKNYKMQITETERCKAVHELVMICFNHGVTDSKIVLRTLITMLRCSTGDYGALMFIINVSTKSKYVEQEYDSPKTQMITIQLRERLLNMNCIAYYLHFANQERFLIYTNRLTDFTELHETIFYLHCLKRCQPKSVLTFFQYGARIFGEEIPNDSSEKGESKSSTIAMFSYVMTDFLYSGCEREQWDENLILKVRLCDLNPDTKDMIVILKILMRVLLNPQDVFYQVARQNLRDHYGSYKVVLKPTFYTIQWLYEDLFPGLGLSSRAPSPLKHLCRYYIRLRMNENWQLPYGIDELEIPRTLKYYLNLLDD